MAILHAKQTANMHIALKDNEEYVVPDINAFNEVICDAIASCFSRDGGYIDMDAPDDPILTSEYEYEYSVTYEVEIYGTYYYTPATWWEPADSEFDGDYSQVIEDATDADEEFIMNYIAKYYPDFADKIDWISIYLMELDDDYIED